MTQGTTDRTSYECAPMRRPSYDAARAAGKATGKTARAAPTRTALSGRGLHDFERHGAMSRPGYRWPTPSRVSAVQ
jgi:hypothetical protein